MSNLMLGALLVYGIPALFAACFWLLVRHLARHLEARDVMDRFRPSRQAVAATDRLIDDIHYDVVVGS